MSFSIHSVNTRAFLFSFLLLIKVCNLLSAQDSSPLSPGDISYRNSPLLSIDDYIKATDLPPSEKIFLHLDRSSYLQKDTLWFKAYQWYGYDQQPDTVSRVLYVDLLDNKGTKKLSRKLLVTDGTSEGDFFLDSTIMPGNYLIRASTRLMQNMDTGEPFYGRINVNEAKKGFQFECSPVISRQRQSDSLQIGFRFFEMDLQGNLKESFSHKINYRLLVSDQVVDSGQVNAVNTVNRYFKKNLAEIDEKASKAIFELSVTEKNVAYRKEFEIPVRDGVDIQFFPEGGQLVGGVPGRVAFKAIGADGLSREVNGIIKTRDDEIITEFKSIHKGMGSFDLIPEYGKEYLAQLEYKGRNYVISLPPVTEKGCVMKITTKDDGSSYLTISCSPQELNSIKYIAGSSNGKVWFSTMLRLTKESSMFKIPVELLPGGICRITILSSDFTPECERLIYVDKDERFVIDIKADSSAYHTRSKVSLAVKTTDLKGAPIQAGLSLSVVDSELSAKDKNATGISAYRLLQSELQGDIEDPDYYFSGGKCSDYEHLDLLLLTHGYRKFLKNTNPEKTYQPETNFHISGSLSYNGVQLGKEKFDYSNVNLTFFTKGEVSYIDKITADSAGRFRLEFPLLYGKSKSLLQATKKNGKKIDCDIFLDEPYIPRFQAPLYSEVSSVTPVFENVQQTQTAIKTAVSKDPSKGYILRDLPDVVVTARAKNWHLDYEKEALKIADLDKLDPQGDKYGSMIDLLVSEFDAEVVVFPHAARTVYMPCLSFDISMYLPIFVVNGEVWSDAVASSGEEFLSELDKVTLLHVNEIKKLSVLPPDSRITEHYAHMNLYPMMKQTTVVIETYDTGYRGDPKAVQTFIIEGLDHPRQFYSPLYNSKSIKNPAYDGRTTLFWAPSIMTDTNGEAKIEFYTTDRRSTFDVTVNGMERGTGASGQNQMMINPY